KQISYYHGCYANYNYPQLGKDFVALMNALGYGVQLLDEKCCGVAKISAGMVDSARRDAVHNVEVFRESLAKGLPVVTVSTSCTLTVREEYPHLLGVENADVKEGINLVERFVYELLCSGKVKLVFKSGYKAKAAYHTPCHQERLGWSIYTLGLLRMIPGLELHVLESHCCGIAGTYGFKKENYETSQKVGKPLFDSIEKVNPEFVACECETCKWQIEMSTGYAVKNPVSVLAEALDLEATARENL
ncbi:MAG: anaerobic glycerol-3-phosphate dehydrogenase subunit C, partial [Bacteroidales bacterium]|nr:anaerobic glycerol-3-phosphate dehydrogenase subunit C [Bacteroidales bacterium]